MKRASDRIVIGLTGGIASGKSSVLREFKRLGAKVIDSDRLAQESVVRGRPAWRGIVRAFGKEILSPDGSIDRGLLRKRILSRPAQRRKLEKIVHPAVVSELKKFFARSKGIVVADIPLLYEAGLQKAVDRTVVVWAPRAVQKRRLLKRSPLTPREAELFLKAQWPIVRKKRLADAVIDNSGSPARTRSQARALMSGWKKILKSGLPY
jgi:dephospho-CoA kinase